MEQEFEEKPFTLTVNGALRTVHATADMPLLWVLRDLVELNGPKFGCGAGICGACTVHLDGAPTRSCQVALGDVGAAKVVTLEGIAEDPIGRRLIDAWVDIDVMQCGYCQSGQIMTAHALVKSNPKPSAAAIDAAMANNLCRCGCYPRIRSAIRMACGQKA